MLIMTLAPDLMVQLYKFMDRVIYIVSKHNEVTEYNCHSCRYSQCMTEIYVLTFLEKFI